MKDKKVIKSSWHAFTNRKSCLTDLKNFYDEMTELVDEGRTVGIVYLDFIMALDIVSHKILTKKLLMDGLGEKTVR